MNKKIEKLIIIILSLIIIYLFYMISPLFEKIFVFLYQIILPFLIGFTLAFILNPIVEFLERKKVSKKIAITIIVLFFISFLVILSFFIIPKTINELKNLFDKIPNYIDNISVFINKLENKLFFLPDNIRPSTEKIEYLFNTNLQKIIDYLGLFLQRTISYILTIIISFVLMIYFLLDYDQIVKYVKRKTNTENNELWFRFFYEVRDTMKAYFKGVFVIMFIMSLLASISFMIVGIDIALLLGVIIGLTDIIPYIGPYIGGFFVIIFTLPFSLKKTIICVIIVIILQTFESYFLTPKIQAKSIKINPIIVLFSFLLFGKLLGIFGMLIAIPMLSIIVTFIKMQLFKKNIKN